MAEANGIYKCTVCGNVVSVLEPHGGTLVCCGKNMELQKEKTAIVEGKEKHVPVMKISGKTVTVNVGSVPHPMEEKHWIVMIQLLKDGKVLLTKRLYPGQKPEAIFTVDDTKGITAREYCNVHGLWKN